MSRINYESVCHENQGCFNNPRQKMWLVQRRGEYGWQIELETNSYQAAKKKAKDLLCAGGTYTNMDRIIVSEIVPIDTVMTP